MTRRCIHDSGVLKLDNLIIRQFDNSVIRRLINTQSLFCNDFFYQHICREENYWLRDEMCEGKDPPG
jgi:hypothetical protein